MSHLPRPPWAVCRTLLLVAAAATCMRATAQDAEPAAGDLAATVHEPRAFGYTVGDVLQRRLVLQVPDGLTLDEESLPRTGRRGRAVELRRIDHQRSPVGGGMRHELTLAYQVFFAPTAVRTFEIAPFRLRFTGTPRDQDLRVEGWPVTVSPLVPVDVSPRRGLGELQPDAPPPLIDTRGAVQRLQAYAAAALLLLAWLAWVYLAGPWLAGRRRPFGLAWRGVRGLGTAPTAEQQRAAYQQVHHALNQTAGEVVFEQGLDRFLHAHPRFTALRGDLARFFQHSRARFFAGEGSGDAAWLVALCRRLRDAERGAA
jgi:mxaA protein